MFKLELVNKNKLAGYIIAHDIEIHTELIKILNNMGQIIHVIIIQDFKKITITNEYNEVIYKKGDK